MARRSSPAIACLAIASIISCNKSGAPPVVAPAHCAIKSAREVKPDKDTELRIWELQTFDLHRLTARLLVATDGKVQTASEVEYKWEPTGSGTGQLVLLIQDGKAFGAKGRLPLLALDFRGSLTPTKTGLSTRLLVAGDLHTRMTHATTDAPQLTEQSILYAQLFVPDDGAGALNCSNVESVVESSKNGRTVIAVALEWAAQ